jgi:hypothetical protein
MGMIENRELARRIQEYYGRYDDAIEASPVFRESRNDGVLGGFASGVWLFDERPVGEIIALARRDQRFAAYLRSQRMGDPPREFAGAEKPKLKRRIARSRQKARGFRESAACSAVRNDRNRRELVGGSVPGDSQAPTVRHLHPNAPGADPAVDQPCHVIKISAFMPLDDEIIFI